MATQSTGGGSTTSFTNTPQGKDDLFTGVGEDVADVLYLDVMANDLGGNAKILWSLDNGTNNSGAMSGYSAADLLTQDTVRAEATSSDTSANGARIWITTTGKVGYDAATLSAAFKAKLQSLAVGETWDDTFIYAIRMSNGTLSWATATVRYSGANDGPNLGSVTATGTVNERADHAPDENIALLTTNGTIAFTDADLSNTHSVSVTPQGGSYLGTFAATITNSATGDGAGEVSWTFTVSDGALDYLTAGQTLTQVYAVKIQDNDGGSVTQNVTVSLVGTNDAPDIQVITTDSAAESVAEANGTLTTGGTLTVTDADLSDVVSSSATGVVLGGTTGGLVSADVLSMLTVTPPTNLAANPGDTHNLAWNFNSGTQAFDFLAVGESLTLTYTVESADGHTGSDSQTVVNTVTGTNDAPVLDAAQTPMVGAVNEDVGAPSGAVGTLVSSLVDFDLLAGGVNNVSDADGGAVTGIALTAVNSSSGTWWYSTDDGGSWAQVNAGTPVANSAALLLAADADTRLYFQPNTNFNGTVSDAITFRAWDQTSGTAGKKVDTSTNGGTTAFSTATDTASITINAVNDAPVASGGATLVAIDEDLVDPAGAAISSLFTGNFSDAADAVSGGSSADSFAGIAISGHTADAAKGSWQYSADGGSSWTPLANATSAAAITLEAAALLRFVPAENYNGPATALSANLIEDGLSISNGAATDLTGATGGTTHVSSGTVALSHTINAVNDAPVVTITSADYTATEQVSLTLKGTGLSVSDVDAAGGSVTATLSVGEGTLNAAAGDSGALVSGSGTASLTITGTVAQVNAFLGAGGTSTLSFVDNTDTPGASTTLSLSVNDNGNSGSGGAQIGNDSATIFIIAVNDAPVNTMPASYGTDEDVSVKLSGLSVADADAGTGTITVTLGVASGTITAANAGGVTVTGSGSGSVQLSGTLSAINAYLAAPASQPTYVPIADANGVVLLTMTTNDGGNTGTGGAQSDTDSININIAAVNDAPVGVDDTGSATEKGGTLNGSGGADASGNVLTNDTDVDDSNASLTVTAVRTGDVEGTGAAGTLGLGLQGDHGTLTLNGDGSYTYVVDEDDAAVEALNSGGMLTDSFNYTVEDPGNLVDTAVLTVTIHGANDAPVANADAGAANEDATLTASAANGVIRGTTGGSVADTDVDNATTSLLVSGAVAGVGAVTQGVGVGTSLAGTHGHLTLAADGSYSYVADTANSLAAGVTAVDTFTYTIKDSGGLVSNSTTLAITVTGVNDAPVLDAAQTPVLSGVDGNSGAPSGAVGTLVSSLVDFDPPASGLNNVSDADSGAVTGIALTAVNSANGTWWYSTDNGSNWTQVNAGTPVANNAALLLAADANSRLYFQPNAGFSGTIGSAITFRAWDQTSGTAGSKVDTTTNGGMTALSTATDSAGITVNNVNQAPTISNLSISATTISFIANDPDNATLSLVAPFAAAFGNPTITSGATTNLAPTEQGAVVQGSLQVTDGAEIVDVVGLYLGTSAGNSFTAGSIATAIYGFTGTDTLTGGSAADWIFGGGSNDTIVGAQNDTLLDGGTGTDTLQVGANFASTSDAQLASIENVLLTAAVTLNLANQSEGFTITGSAGADSITAGGGGDTIVGAQNDTLLDGDGGTDTLQVGANFASTSDAQIASIENVTLTAAVTLDLSNQSEGFTITGSNGADTITGGSGADSISAGNNADTINGAQNDALLDGGNGTDTLQIGANFASTSDAQIASIENVTLTAAVTLNLANQTEAFTITGSSGADTITGGTAADSISGGGGNDTLAGAQNDTLLDGGADSDTLQVGANFTSTGDAQIVTIENVLLTAAATLNLANQTEAFAITGSSGADTITGGSGADSISSGGGNDIINGAQNDVLLDGGANGDTLQVGANFTSTSNAQIANIETVLLTATITLNLANQTEALNINGSSGADSITAGNGNDTINGQGGSDTLTGGAGVDQFRFRSYSGTDVVTDLAVASDKIAFLEGTATGAVDFTTAGTASGATLGAADFASRSTITGLLNADDQKVVVITSQQTTTQITSDTAGGSQNDYVVVFNSTTSKAEIWFDDNWANVANRVQVAALNGVTAAQVAALTASNFVVYDSTLGPAGASGSAIDLALPSTGALAAGVSVTISGMQGGWLLSSGIDNGDGSWTVDYADLDGLSITTPASFSGAALLTASQSWTNADGTTGYASLENNVAVYAAGNPIFAWTADDHLTGSSGADLFVFSQPIGSDIVYSFDAAADRVDLVGFDGFVSFADVQAHLSDNGDGDAVIALGAGMRITLDGVDAASLTADNFVFDLSPAWSNAATITVGDGAMLPVAGTVHNSGTISLASEGGSTLLQIIQHGVTLDGGGSLVLSDDGGNVIEGTLPDVTFTNVDNAISGAGQIGNGQLTLVNGGSIAATGTNALVIDTGDNAVVNSGTIAATGSGGLTVASSIVNDGLLWANGGTVTLMGAVSGDGDARISGTASLDFGAASSAGVAIDEGASGKIILHDSDAFTGVIAGLDDDDLIDLRDIAFGVDSSLSYAADADGSGGVLTVSDGTHSASIALLGLYDAEDFHLEADDHAGTLVLYGGHPLHL
jgi:VCBS repeat-containing protein